MEEDRQVPRSTAQELADKYKWFFIEASAKTKTNVWFDGFFFFSFSFFSSFFFFARIYDDTSCTSNDADDYTNLLILSEVLLI
jgi:hypothetical protein